MLKKLTSCLMAGLLSGIFALKADPLLPLTPSLSLKPLPSKAAPIKPRSEMEYRQVVTFYPFKALSNYIMIGYEKQIGYKNALKISAGYTNFEESNFSNNFDFDLKEFSGLKFDFMLKYFIGKNNAVFNGLYCAPYLSFKNSKFKYQDFSDFQFPTPVWEEGAANSFTAAITFGYQLPLGKAFTMDLYVGNGLRKSSGDYREASRFLDPYLNSIGLIAGFSAGFGF